MKGKLGTYLLLGCLICCKPMFAQDLFTEVTIENGLFSPQQIELIDRLRSEKSTIDLKLVRVNVPLLRSQNSIDLELFAGKALTIANAEIIHRSDNEVTWLGYYRDFTNSCSITQYQDAIVGSFLIDGKAYVLRYLGSGLNALLQVDPAMYNVCGMGENGREITLREHSESTQLELNSGSYQRTGRRKDSSGTMSSSQVSTIRLLVPYTSNALNYVGGSVTAMNGTIQDAIAAGNVTFDSNHSNLPITFELAQAVEINYEEGASETTIFHLGCPPSAQMNDDLINLRNTGDNILDEVHGLRDAYAADVVLLVTDPNKNSIAQAYNFGASAEDAFAICPVTALGAPSWSLTHEIGHLLGARHEMGQRTNQDTCTTPFGTGHGYILAGDDYRTMMAVFIPQGNVRIQFWSHSDKTYLGLALGSGLYTYAATMLQSNAPAMANFRTNQINLTQDLVIGSGQTWTLEAGSTVKASPNVQITINGTLIVNGASGNPVTFTRSGSSGSWDGIQFQSGGSGTLTYATIDYAAKGVYLSGAGGVTIDNCTFRNFSEQAVYSLNSSPTVKNCAIQNPAGASHGIYLSSSGSPAIQNNTIDGITTGIERSGSPGTAAIHDNTIKNCTTGLKTYQSSPEIYNNTFDNNVYGIRLATSSSPDIHDNDLTTNSSGVYLEQSQPSRVKWNNFGWSGFTQENSDEGILVNYLQAGNTFLDNQWNNFYDGEVTNDISNTTGTLLKARGNYWSSFSVTGQVDAGSPQSSHNNDAGPGGALGKIAGREFTETSATGAPVAASFGLGQNFPNPFNPSTVIRFRLSCLKKKPASTGSTWT